MEFINSNTEIEILELETCGRFIFKKCLGRGSYGIVYSAYDKLFKKDVAIKRIEKIFDSILDAKRCLREIKILSNLNHENIAALLDVYCLPDFENFKAIILVLELMETDMNQIITSGQNLLVDHHRYFIYQILRGLKYLHSANILHRDLKPSNLLLNSNCDLKISDFGLSRILDDEPPEFLSEYVTTRWYRAPEVLLNYKNYGPPMDMWSIGCITAELILKRPLFTGKSTTQQLQLINEILGSPTEEDLEDCVNPKARDFMYSLPNKPKIELEKIFKNHEFDNLEIDFINNLLIWDPKNRMTIHEALEHPFMSKLHDVNDEPETYPLNEFDFERNDITLEILREEMWKEVVIRHPEFEN